MSNKCLDDELFDIYMQDGETIIKGLRKIYSKGFMDGVNDTSERFKSSAYKQKYDSELLDKFVTRLEDYFVIPHDVFVIEQMAEEMKAEEVR